MQQLHDLQRQFSRFVLQDSDQIPDGIIANGMTAEQRLSIYRNNTRLGLTEVLRDVYPVVNQLVGVAFFNRLAQAYLASHPLQTGSLLTFGGQFSEMIAEFEAAQSLAYLPDVAALEWLWHEAYHEADAEPLPLSRLAQVDPADFDRIGFQLHPSARFMASKYPIAQIWAANQPDTPADSMIDLQQGGCRLLIYRPAYAVEIVSLEAAAYDCLRALASGTAFSPAVEQVIADHPDFDVQTHLQQWLQLGVFTDLFLI
jgi:hypothetical protein